MLSEISSMIIDFEMRIVSLQMYKNPNSTMEMELEDLICEVALLKEIRNIEDKTIKDLRNLLKQRSRLVSYNAKIEI